MEDVGVRDPDPGEAADLEVSFLDAGEEGSPLKGLDLNGNTYLSKLLLDHGRDAPAHFVLRRLVRQSEAGERTVAVGIGEPGFVEEPPRPCRIERHRGKIRIVRPRPRGVDRGYEVGAPLPDRLDIS
jgi:hypothetical protein